MPVRYPLYLGCQLARGEPHEPEGIAMARKALRRGRGRDAPPGQPERKARHQRAARVAAAAATEKAQQEHDRPQGALSKDDLVSFLQSGCKPPEAFCIGTEHEKFGFRVSDHKPIDYEQIRSVLERIADQFGWTHVVEDNHLVGLKKDGQSISLEPGGQFELSGAPLEDVHQTCAEVNSHLHQVKSVSEELGIRFLGLGFNPRQRRDEVPIMPKKRYEIMRQYMPTRGSLGLDMMLRTCTIQVNLDFSSENDMVRKFRASLALQSIATALFANSPFKEGSLNGFTSYRSHIWTDTDPDRTGNLPFVFESDFGFERYVDYMLDVPMYFVNRHGDTIDCTDQSFKQFMRGELPQLPGELPTIKDWEDHLSTAFPEVRMKRFLEMRGADGGPWRRICALPAFWVGLLYDEQALQESLDLVSDWTWEEQVYLRDAVPKSGLQTPFRRGSVRDLAHRVLEISRGGLERRGKSEEQFLRILELIVQRGRSTAEDLLELYETEWQHDVSRVYDKMVY